MSQLPLWIEEPVAQMFGYQTTSAPGPSVVRQPMGGLHPGTMAEMGLRQPPAPPTGGWLDTIRSIVQQRGSFPGQMPPAVSSSTSFGFEAPMNPVGLNTGRVGAFLANPFTVASGNALGLAEVLSGPLFENFTRPMLNSAYPGMLDDASAWNPGSIHKMPPQVGQIAEGSNAILLGAIKKRLSELNQHADRVTAMKQMRERGMDVDYSNELLQYQQGIKELTDGLMSQGLSKQAVVDLYSQAQNMKLDPSWAGASNAPAASTQTPESDAMWARLKSYQEQSAY